jgi:carboxylesterase
LDWKLLQGAEPVFLSGTGENSKIGCLCLHGLSASPQEMYWLGKSLADHGATVFIPRLYGHGVVPDQLRYMRWQDWYLSALDGYHLLKHTCDRIVVLGLSTGGLLGLRLAAAENAAGVVTMAAPILPPAKNAWLTHIVRYFNTYVAHYDQVSDPIDQRIRQLQQERGETITGRVASYKQSAAGVAELLKLYSEVRTNLARVRAPVLLIYSEKDTTATTESLKLIQARLTASAAVTTLQLKESSHIITNDIESDKVFDAAWNFVAQVASARATS